jgi:hypothetical protein
LLSRQFLERATVLAAVKAEPSVPCGSLDGVCARRIITSQGRDEGMAAGSNKGMDLEIASWRRREYMFSVFTNMLSARAPSIISQQPENS